MKTFNGMQWIAIDLANHYGLDKETFETRLEWAKTHLDELETLSDKAEVPELYLKGVMALRKAQQGIPTGHLVGLDAVCSGVQIMSALTGCHKGARATGLVDPEVRADAYSTCTKEMQRILGTTLSITRQQAKDAMMKAFYASKKEPKVIFGEDTPELDAFYKAISTIAPGAWGLLQDLVASWNPTTLSHEWKLPDGFDVKVKVMKKVEKLIEVDELDHSRFTYTYYVNEAEKFGLSNAANVVHSVDAYVLRTVHRRCNYKTEMVERASKLINKELNDRANGDHKLWFMVKDKLEYYCDQYDRSGIADVVVLEYLNPKDMGYLSTEHLESLQKIVAAMLIYEPFEVVAIHDEYKCHPNNMNALRGVYREVLAELADSDLIQDLLNQLYKANGKYKKQSNTLGNVIRQSNYALC